MYTRYILKSGDRGIAVNKMQGYLNLCQKAGYIHTLLAEDGIFGAKMSLAVKEFQLFARLNPDGVIGSNTWDAIMETIKNMNITTNIPVASSAFYLQSGNTGIDVFKMQEYLNEIAAVDPCLRPVFVDGSFGNSTRIGVQQFQYLHAMTIDGLIGSATWDAIVNERNKIGKE